MTTTVVSLSDMKAHLRYPTPSQPTSDDPAIQGFIDAAEECIRFEVDETIPRTYSERHDGGCSSIWTYHRPVLSVLNIEEGWGYQAFQLDFQDANTGLTTSSLYAYSIDNAEVGEITRRSGASVVVPFAPGKANIFIQYVAGHAPVPASIVFAVKELVAHWWQNSQQRGLTLAGANIAYDAVEGAVYTRDTESGVQNINLGIPYRILEPIKGNRKLPIIA